MFQKNQSQKLVFANIHLHRLTLFFTAFFICCLSVVRKLEEVPNNYKYRTCGVEFRYVCVSNTEEANTVFGMRSFISNRNREMFGHYYETV